MNSSTYTITIRAVQLLVFICTTADFADGQTSGGGRPPGSALTTIVVPAKSPKQRQETAQTLQFYIRESTGKEIPIAAKAGPALTIHVGRSPYVDALDLKLETLDGDGFVLKGIDAHNYVIAGPTEYGTEFGVYEFLERYLGVRWLLPGRVGTDVPRSSTLKVLPDEVRQQPAYFSRLHSGWFGPIQLEWARRNREHGRIEFHHNLYRLLPASQYRTTRPDFFSLVDGKRSFPKNDDDSNWQPNFSAPGIVEEAADAIRDYFRLHPQETTCSLGINDTDRFDESLESLARESKEPNYLGCRNVSESYYRWCNDVVAKVLEEYPDKYFGCLAYSQTADPPKGFKLNSHIIPYLTYERLRWCDPHLRQLGHDVTTRWEAAASILGWYDYAYGQCYCVPRVYPHLMADYFRYGRDHGVRAHYAEMYANWGEGPKPYIYLKLQWNPDLDVDQMLDDWYMRCVGPDAAPLLKEYYAIWERYWTVDVQKSKWWVKNGQYMDDLDPTYMSEVQESDVHRSRELLDNCVAKAQTELQRKRAELLRMAFGYYEASALAYRPTTLARTQHIRNEADALAMADEVATSLKMNQRRLELTKQFRSDPILLQIEGMEKYPKLSGELWHADLLWRLIGWTRSNPAVRARLETLASFPSPAVRKNVQIVLALATDGQAERLSANASLEEGLASWDERMESPVGTVKVVDGTARTGTHSLLCEGVQRGGLAQMVPVKPGLLVVVVYVFVPQGQPVGGLIGLTAQPRGSGGKAFSIRPLEQLPMSGEWVPIVFPVDMPAAIDGIPITNSFLFVYAANSAPGQRIYMDDMALYRLPDGLK